MHFPLSREIFGRAFKSLIIPNPRKNADKGLPGGPVVKARLPTKGARIQSLVRELRSYVPHGMTKKKKKRMQSKETPYELLFGVEVDATLWKTFGDI